MVEKRVKYVCKTLNLKLFYKINTMTPPESIAWYRPPIMASLKIIPLRMP